MSEIRRELAVQIRLLLNSMQSLISDASLAERATAASRLIDRLVKLSDPMSSFNNPHPSQIVSYRILGSEGFEPDDDPEYTHEMDDPSTHSRDFLQFSPAQVPTPDQQNPDQ